jgi:hypothetical protein
MTSNSVTALEQWRQNALSSDDRWLKRAQTIAALVEPGDVVLDLGAGDQKLRTLLPDGCRYLPVDCVDALPDTFVVDFNAGFALPPGPFDLIVSAGFFEYVKDLPSFMTALAKSCEGTRVIFSYSYSRPKSGDYLKLNAMRNSRECIRFFGPYVDGLREVDAQPKQSIFTGRLRTPVAAPQPRWPAALSHRLHSFVAALLYLVGA